MLLPLLWHHGFLQIIIIHSDGCGHAQPWESGSSVDPQGSVYSGRYGHAAPWQYLLCGGYGHAQPWESRSSVDHHGRVYSDGNGQAEPWEWSSTAVPSLYCVVHSTVNTSVLISFYWGLLFVFIVLWFMNIYLLCTYPYSRKTPYVGLEERFS